MKKLKRAFYTVFLLTGLFLFNTVLRASEVKNFIFFEVLNRQDTSKWSPEQEELWKLEEIYMTHYKNRDVEAISDFWHEEFIGWPAGSEFPRNKSNAQKYLQNPSGSNILSFKIRPQTISIYGNTALVYYFIDTNMKNNKGETSIVTFRIIHTWIKENNKWQILGGMSAK